MTESRAEPMVSGHGAQQQQARFYEFIWPHSATLLRAAQFFTRSAADAEDLAQDAMIKAYNAMDCVSDPQLVKPWLMTILRRTWIDRWRQRQQHRGDVSLDQIEFDPPGVERATAASFDELAEDPDRALNAFSDGHVIRALKQLPDEVRWTLLLVDVEGLDDRDAAAALDVPVGTIKSRLHRGRAMLRDSLSAAPQRMGVRIAV